MPIRSQDLLLSHDHLRHQAQTCDWFLFSFHKIADQISAEHGAAIELNEDVLKVDFLRWHGFFTGNKEALRTNRRAFILYAAGLMARELLRSTSALKVQVTGGASDALALWPEGYCVFRYCAEVAAAIIEEEFGERVSFKANEQALALWASLKENVSQDPRYAVPFLQQLMGEQPDWRRMDLPPQAPLATLPRTPSRFLH